MQAKSGKKIAAVKPVEPDEVFDADEADPGKVEQVKAEQLQKQSGKYGKQPITPYKKPSDDDETKDTFKVRLTNDAGEPLTRVPVIFGLALGEVEETTDSDGVAEVDTGGERTVLVRVVDTHSLVLNLEF